MHADAIVVESGSNVGDDCIDPGADVPARVEDDNDKVVDDVGNLYGLYPPLPVVADGVEDDASKNGMNPGDGDPEVDGGEVDDEDGILYGINPVGAPDENTDEVVDLESLNGRIPFVGEGDVCPENLRFFVSDNGRYFNFI